MEPTRHLQKISWEETGKNMCHAYGILSPTEDEVNHMAVLAQAFSIYCERELEYGSAWKQHGSQDNVNMAQSKIRRMTSGLTPKVIGDSALDCINFCVFFFLNKRAGR